MWGIRPGGVIQTWATRRDLVDPTHRDEDAMNGAPGLDVEAASSIAIQSAPLTALMVCTLVGFRFFPTIGYTLFTRMSYSEKTIKMLWGRAANRCAICRTELVMDRTGTDDESVVGEIAHIVARDEDGNTAARAVNLLSTLEQEEYRNQIEHRNKYGNLILLCRIHHKQIDDQPNTYNVKKLLELKSNHELWVKSSLDGYDPLRQRDEELYADYIDKWVDQFDILNWENWTSGLLAAQPSIRKSMYDKIDVGRRWLLNRVWLHRFPSLNEAFENFRRVAEALYTTFDEWKEEFGERLLTEKFYKRWYNFIRGDDRKLHELHLLERKYDYHVGLLNDLTLELTRAANRICDEVRAHVDPSFMLEEGRLTVQQGPDMHLTFTTFVVQYDSPSQHFLDLGAFKVERSSRQYHVGSD
jgi:hypothetical protein